jgi:hypothetical protein
MQGQLGSSHSKLVNKTWVTMYHAICKQVFNILSNLLGKEKLFHCSFTWLWGPQQIFFSNQMITSRISQKDALLLLWQVKLVVDSWHENTRCIWDMDIIALPSFTPSSIIVCFCAISTNYNLYASAMIKDCHHSVFSIPVYMHYYTFLPLQVHLAEWTHWKSLGQLF